jgi:hypothetical protein
MKRRLDFDLINSAALPRLPILLARWCPGGTIRGVEYVARNPRRNDRHPGSFSVNMRSGAWADFSSGDRGRGAISLASYLANIAPYDAATRLAEMLGVPELMARADATVLVVEGEKAVDAAQQRFPEFVVTTSMGGANAASKTDWAALKGHEVIIFPDADAPGVRYASDVAKLAREAARALCLELASQHCHRGIMAQRVVVDQVFVTQGDPEHALAHQRCHIMLDQIGAAGVLEARRKPTNQTDRVIRGTQQQRAGIRPHRSTIKGSDYRAPFDTCKSKQICATLCRHRGPPLKLVKWFC